ncbi:TetR family transcriptional regulator [Actinoallomurus sp. CA-150999]|uniref:acyl-CoA-like ligand-binding transcription factor n=1 Tax=Actinoallomurus sp. CA-150999 TaxID=3239887 RepID=UPI003D93BE3D
MTSSPEEGRRSHEPARTAGGLRARKKARTRAAIQREALRLFTENGYDATTVEQVADAAEVAPSTVFRYFPTKEDLVISDAYDPLVYAAFEAQPPELSVVQALRGALRATLGELSPEELAEGRERTTLMLSVPALRGAGLGNFTATMMTVADLVAKRIGRDPDDPHVRAFTGAVFGVMLDLMLRWAEDPELDLIAALDEALAFLETGLSL